MAVLDQPEIPTHEMAGARFTTLAAPSLGTTSVSVWRLQLRAGEPATPHRLTGEEIFVATDGEASGRLGGTPFRVRAGQVLLVPAGTDFEITSDAGFEALVYIAVGTQAIIGDGEPFTPPWAI